MARNGPSGNRSRAGFTLVEIMVSVAVLALMLALLSPLFSLAQRSMSSLGNAARQRQDARTVLLNMSKELRSALVPVAYNYEGFSGATQQPQLLINPANLETGLRNADSIFWQGAVPSGQAGSGLVGYCVQWDTSNPGHPQPWLCRAFLNMNTTAQPVQAMLQSSSSYSTWLTSGLVPANAPGGANSGYQGWLADNVLALYVRALDPNMQPITASDQGVILGMYLPPTFDAGGIFYGVYAVQFSASKNGTPYTSVSSTYAGGYNSALGYQYQTTGTPSTLINRFGPVLPAAVEIAIVTAPPQVIQQLTSVPTVVSTNPTAMWTDLNTFVGNLPKNVGSQTRTYSTIVSLSTQP